jgi:hypothetical protein
MAIALAVMGRRDDALAATGTGLAIAEKEAQKAGAAVVEHLAPWACRFQAARARRALGDAADAADLLEQTAAGLRPLVAARPALMIPSSRTSAPPPAAPSSTRPPPHGPPGPGRPRRTPGGGRRSSTPPAPPAGER